ncbi:MAG: AraC family transcriptional regulator [Verrucomicrobia bacterium]|nr:MAG: AraC family transcriptional regulator [Verrucomicrobiota bacterium]
MRSNPAILSRRPGEGADCRCWRAEGGPPAGVMRWECRPLFGELGREGFRFEWHAFGLEEDLEWRRELPEGCVEICLNLAGRAMIRTGRSEVRFLPGTAGCYCAGADGPLRARRWAEPNHGFLTLTLTPAFLREHLASHREALHPMLEEVLAAGRLARSRVWGPQPLDSAGERLVETLRTPPVAPAALPLWYPCKAHELMARFLFRQAGPELFCSRQQRAARERVDRVKQLLEANLAEPPSLQEIARQVGCSAFHLSRTFSRQTGLTIPQYLRQKRMEAAARMLAAGTHNVTEAAMAVGYNSLSHFSVAFHETFGCCPGLYPWGCRKPAG